MHRLVFLLLCLWSLPAYSAGAPRLYFPADCDLGKTCWLMTLPDADAAADKARAYDCGQQTRDGYRSTDIAIANLTSMAEGVDVLAPAGGTVTGVRDSEEDSFKPHKDQTAIKKAGKACGNGVLLQHGDGWTTQLCHLRKGSIPVKKGDTVKGGDKIGQIGLSGVTDHPHVSLTVRKDGKEIDPFSGGTLETGLCGERGNPLWRDRIQASGFDLYDAGFSAKTPDFAGISQGQKPADAARGDKALTFWFAYFGARKGDRISLQIAAPAGRLMVEDEIVLKLDQPRQYAFVGKPLMHPLGEGTHKGTARVTRVMPDGSTLTRIIERTLIIK